MNCTDCGDTISDPTNCASAWGLGEPVCEDCERAREKARRDERLAYQLDGDLPIGCDAGWNGDSIWLGDACHTEEIDSATAQELRLWLDTCPSAEFTCEGVWQWMLRREALDEASKRG